MIDEDAMTGDEAPVSAAAAPAEDADVVARRKRMRTALAVTLALLVLLLLGMAAFIFRVLTPPGRPKSGDLPQGMTWIRSIYGFGPSEDEQLRVPNDTAVGRDGTIWVTDPQRARVLGFTPGGDFRRIVHTGSRSTAEGHLFLPDTIDTDDNGDVYVADYGRSAVLVFSEDGRFLREWQVPQPLEVDVTPERVTVSTVNGIALFDKTGEILGLVGTRGKGTEQFDGPRGVVTGPDGTFYVADTHNRRVKAYDSSGKLLWQYPTDPAKAGAEGFQLPVGLTMDASGRLVLLDAFDFQVVVLDPRQKGRLVGRYGDFGQTDGKFLYPTGISYDRDRDYFVIADTRNDRAQVVRIEGSGGGLPGAARRLFTGPMRLCSIPLILLLVALAVYVMRRRSRATPSPLEDTIPGEVAEDPPAPCGEGV